jgi:hypothetical protein
VHVECRRTDGDTDRRERDAGRLNLEPGRLEPVGGDRDLVAGIGDRSSRAGRVRDAA